MIYRTALRIIGRPAWAAPAPGDDPLRDMATDVAARYPDVEQVTPTALAMLLTAEPDRIMLFDVREPPEFTVSHLPSAVLVPPRTHVALSKVQDALARQPAVEVVVFYCSVGVRSSALASHVYRASDGNGTRPVPRIANLAGGLFRWVNDGRPLVNGQDCGATTAVHPFNRHWGQFLLKRQDAAG
jgi:rhodanese-related sulfurtransferase